MVHKPSLLTPHVPKGSTRGGWSTPSCCSTGLEGEGEVQQQRRIVHEITCLMGKPMSSHVVAALIDLEDCSRANLWPYSPFCPLAAISPVGFLTPSSVHSPSHPFPLPSISLPYFIYPQVSLLVPVHLHLLQLPLPFLTFSAPLHPGPLSLSLPSKPPNWRKLAQSSSCLPLLTCGLGYLGYLT